LTSFDPELRSFSCSSSSSSSLAPPTRRAQAFQSASSRERHAEPRHFFMCYFRHFRHMCYFRYLCHFDPRAHGRPFAPGWNTRCGSARIPRAVLGLTPKSVPRLTLGSVGLTCRSASADAASPQHCFTNNLSYQPGLRGQPRKSIASLKHLSCARGIQSYKPADSLAPSGERFPPMRISRIEPLNRCKSSAWSLHGRGNRFSLSQGERAGVRADFFILTSLLGSWGGLG
jgi:hypothetical protein